MDGYYGEIRLFAGNFAPRNWAFCQGQVLDLEQNSALYSVIGSFYGGDDQKTFNLPDLRGRVAISSGQGPGLSSYSLGAAGGVEDVYLNVNEIPSHTHSMQSSLNVSVGVVEDDGNSQEVAGHALANSPSEEFYSSNSPSGQLAGVQVTGSVTAGNTGGNLSHENRMPFLAVNYIICTSGEYPPRS